MGNDCVPSGANRSLSCDPVPESRTRCAAPKDQCRRIAGPHSVLPTGGSTPLSHLPFPITGCGWLYEHMHVYPRSGPVHAECVVVPLTPLVPSTTEIVNLYTWMLKNRHSAAVAYRYLSLSMLQPAPNQSHRTAQSISEWCDTQIDAFTLWWVRYNHRIRADQP